MPVAMAKEDLATLRWATEHLEHPSLAARLTSVVGTPIEIAFKLLPRALYKRLHSAADAAIAKAFGVATSSLHHAQERDPHSGVYRVLAAGTGAVGGLFGLYGLALDLPVTTTLMLRSIAEIARSQGEDIRSAETRLACLEVFALGGHAESDDAAETGYYGIRLALALPITQAARHIAEQGLSAKGGAPMIVDVIRLVSSRFGIAVSEKAAAVAVPIVGAATGAAINLVFMDHFQEMARGHFVVRRLERKYGQQLVQGNYEAILQGS
ncbi:MAG: EcsC family protein [Chromatiaceae bacterium]